jgi:hypothetical protein
MTIRALVLIFLLMPSRQVQADTPMCFFEVSSQPVKFDLEFAGGNEVQMIYYSAPGIHNAGIPFELVDFDANAERVHLIYENQGDARLPPSFTLIGSGDKVRVHAEGKELLGTLDCYPFKGDPDD